LIGAATELDVVDAEFKAIINEQLIRDITALIPNEWLGEDAESAAERREVYVQFLLLRTASSENFINEAKNAREKRF
jgi:hypothetical protein